MVTALPPGALTDPAALAAATSDRSGRPGAEPLAVVRAVDVDHVVEVLRWATSTRTPVVTRGGGSGLAGGAVATQGAVVLDVAGLDRIVSLDPVDEIAVVEPGVITADLDAAAREHGLFYAPDPASAHLSTIGGNIATNAGGMRCVKYGVTRDAVLGLEVVLADGRRLATGRGTLKGVTGYDLTSLLVGSEGTLGVIVGATLRLRPVPVAEATVAASFADVESAAAATSALAAGRLVPSVLELLDARTLATIDAAQGTSLSDRGGALVLARTDGPDAASQASAVTAVLGATATWSEHTEDAARADELLAARRLALPSIERFGRALIEDVCVPRSRLAEAVRGIEAISAETGVTVHTFAHAGDGNLHPIVSWDPRLGDEVPEDVQLAADRIFDLALELGGTLTGEHGVGLLKREHARRELGDTGLDVHRAIKHALDPLGLLNPGKAF